MVARAENDKYRADSIYWVEVERITPNPFQPRRTFDEAALKSLADSIRQYGVLQPLVVTKKETEREGEGIFVEYELIAGERRLRAAKLANVSQVPVVIRPMQDTEEDQKLKLELAIIENLQREDINAVDRARAFKQLVDEFRMTHQQVGEKIGKSREYVSNTIRILLLPEEMLQALADGKISDGHTRPLLMLSERPEEQQTLFREIIDRRMSVREAERTSRHIAVERTRKPILSPELASLERTLTETLGTRVVIEPIKEHDAAKGGRVTISFFSPEDLEHLKERLEALTVQATSPQPSAGLPPQTPEEVEKAVEDNPTSETDMEKGDWLEPKKEEDDDMYSVRNFSL